MAITIEQLRLLTGDNETTELLTDAQYTLVLGIESDNIYNAAYLACSAIAGLFGTKVSVTAATTVVQNQQKYDHYIELAERYRKMAREGKGNIDDASSLASAPALSGVSISDMDSVASDTDRPDSQFTIGMDKNEETQTNEDFCNG